MKTIDEIVNTFITDLKRTKEYKEAWRTIPSVDEIIFDFRTKTFKFRHRAYSCDMTGIVMDEEVLLGK